MDPKVALPDAGSGFRKGKPKKVPPPATIAGKTLAPDTYILSLVHGRIGVLRSNLDFVGYLDEKPKIEGKKLKKNEKGVIEIPSTTFLIESDETTGPHFLRRLHGRVDDLIASGELPMRLSLSAGLVQYPTDGGDVDALFRLADERLYEAKRAKAA
jgi:hypothetical protein